MAYSKCTCLAIFLSYNSQCIKRLETHNNYSTLKPLGNQWITKKNLQNRKISLDIQVIIS